jgi:anti-sigma regulatory factor (Ser/Thr protein kinase)
MPYHRCPACGLTGYSAAAWSAARTCANCGAPLPANSRLEVVPRASHSVSRSLLARPHASAQARHTVAALDVPQSMRETLTLVVTEIVNNSVLHAGMSPDDSVELHMDVAAEHVRLVVHDSGPGFDPATLDGPRDALVAGGNGLLIVESLTAGWGVERGPDGCTVWCDLTPDGEYDPAHEHGPSAGTVHEAQDQPAVAASA